MICAACDAAHDGRGDLTVKATGPEPDTRWRGLCWRCGWAVVEPYPEDANGEADDHACPMRPTCGHHARRALVAR